MSKTPTAPTAIQTAESVKPFVVMAGHPGANLVAIAAGILASMTSAATLEQQNEIIRELHKLEKLPKALAAEISLQQAAHWATVAAATKERGPFVAAITDPYFRKGKDQTLKNRIGSCICINGGDFNYRRNSWISCNIVRQLCSLDDAGRAGLVELCNDADQATLTFDQQNDL